MAASASVVAAVERPQETAVERLMAGECLREQDSVMGREPAGVTAIGEESRETLERDTVAQDEAEVALAPAVVPV